MKQYLSAIVLLTVCGSVAFAQPESITGGRVECVDGNAAGFPCKDVDLLSFVSLRDLGPNKYGVTDIWGWTDPETGSEYALICRSAGVAVVDISDPINPVLIGQLDRRGAQDLKIYRNYAVVTGDRSPEAGQPGSGLQLFDLTEIRSVTNPPATFTPSAEYNGFTGAHNIAINEESGFAYPVGGGGGEYDCGGVLFVHLADPLHPRLAGCFDSGWVHDAQCVNYQGPDEAYADREICFLSAGGRGLVIADVTDKAAPKIISEHRYPGTALAHQGWTSEDHRYFFLDDEWDENDENPYPRTIVLDVSDLDDPVFVREYLGGATSIDHNLYVRRNYLFAANYTSGLRVVDLTGFPKMWEAAYFDTHPPDDALSFRGAWSSFPFFASGTIVVSSREEGLFMLRPTSVDYKPFIGTEIEAINATATHNTVLLTWTTSYERDNIGFHIQVQPLQSDRNADTDLTNEVEWNTVAFVEGKGQATTPSQYEYTITDLEAGTYRFRLRQENYLGNAVKTKSVEVLVVPHDFVISDVHPNPVTSASEILLGVDRSARVRVDIYDALGRRVRTLFDGFLNENTTHRFSVPADGLPSGTYFVAISSEHFSVVRKAVLAR